MRDALIIIAVGIVAVAIGIAVLGSGGGAPAALPADTVATSTAVFFEQVDQGEQSSVLARKNYLVTSQSELTELWRMIGTKEQPPSIDFASSDVIAVFAGKKPTAGYAIAVSQVEDGISRKITITLTKPGGSCLLAQVETAPYQVIEVPKSALPLTREEKEVTQGCL